MDRSLPADAPLLALGSDSGVHLLVAKGGGHGGSIKRAGVAEAMAEERDARATVLAAGRAFC